MIAGYAQNRMRDHGRPLPIKPFLKHVAYSTWQEVLDEIMRVRPTWLQFGCHSGKETGIHLYGNKVQPERILPAIQEWNAFARSKGWAYIRVLVLNACDSDVHAEKLKQYHAKHKDAAADRPAPRINTAQRNRVLRPEANVNLPEKRRALRSEARMQRNQALSSEAKVNLAEKKGVLRSEARIKQTL